MVLALLAAGALVLATTTSASAHSELLESNPADGAELDEAPGEITLRYNENIESIGALVVITGPDGDEVQDGEPSVDGMVLTQPVSDDAPAGSYSVQWRVVSADGHPIDGEFTFEAAAPAGGESTEEATEDATEEPTEDATEEETTEEATEEATEDVTEEDATEEATDTSTDASEDDDDGGFGLGAAFAIGGAAAVVVLGILGYRRIRSTK